MKMKKVLPLMLTVALIAVVGVGATLAYFTDKADVTNVITMGNVDIDLDEPNFDPTPDGEKDNKIEDVMPGQVIAKDPTITLGANSLDAFIRVKLEVTGFEDIENGDAYVVDIIDGLDIQENWTKIGDYYYYGSALTNSEQGANVATLFTEVTIPTSWNNAVADVEFNIVVSVEAVQADNLADDFFNEDGSWNITTEEILAYEEAIAQ